VEEKTPSVVTVDITKEHPKQMTMDTKIRLHWITLDYIRLDRIRLDHIRLDRIRLD
jgi:hypothetical protein